MTIPSRDYTAYLRTARRRAQEVTAYSVERHEKAWAVARRAALFIKERCPTAQVRAFGSLLYPDSFGPTSDIDLAVEGIEWPEYLRVWGALDRREPEFEIDLVDVSVVSDGLRAHIEREGVVLGLNATGGWLNACEASFRTWNVRFSVPAAHGKPPAPLPTQAPTLTPSR